MGFMPLGSCCGCYSLKSGARIVGILCLFFCTVQMYAYAVASMSVWRHWNDNQVVVNILLVMIVLVTAQFVVSIILLIGVHKDRPNFIVCWVIAYSSLLIVGFIFVTGLVFLMSPSFLWILSFHVVFIYFVLVVYSLYRQYVIDMFAVADAEKGQHT